MLSPEELLAGSRLSFTITVPKDVLIPDLQGTAGPEAKIAGEADGSDAATVKMRPLTVADLQIISRAAKENDTLLGVLMVQRSLIEPQLSVAEVSALHLGLMQFLLSQVNSISGLNISQRELENGARDPLARAAFLLAREFGWSPQEISELTLGQIMLHLEMLESREGGR